MTSRGRDSTAYTLLWQRRHPDEAPLAFQEYAVLRTELDELDRREREIHEQRALVQERLRI